MRGFGEFYFMRILIYSPTERFYIKLYIILFEQKNVTHNSKLTFIQAFFFMWQK